MGREPDEVSSRPRPTGVKREAASAAAAGVKQERGSIKREREEGSDVPGGASANRVDLTEQVGLAGPVVYAVGASQNDGNMVVQQELYCPDWHVGFISRTPRVLWLIWCQRRCTLLLLSCRGALSTCSCCLHQAS